MADFVALLVPPDVADLLVAPADQVPHMLVVQNKDDIERATDERTVVVIPALGDGTQPAFTTKLTERARKVVSFPWVLKDREQARKGFAKFDGMILGRYRNYLDDQIYQLRKQLVTSMSDVATVVACMERAYTPDMDELEDELASAKQTVEHTRAQLGRYRKELENVLELEKASDQGTTVTG